MKFETKFGTVIADKFHGTTTLFNLQGEVVLQFRGVYSKSEIEKQISELDDCKWYLEKNHSSNNWELNIKK